MTRQNLIEKVVKTMCYDYKEFSKVKFKSGLEISDVIAPEIHHKQFIYITEFEAAEKENEIFIYDCNGEIRYIITCHNKTNIEIATLLTMAICNL